MPKKPASKPTTKKTLNTPKAKARGTGKSAPPKSNEPVNFMTRLLAEKKAKQQSGGSNPQPQHDGNNVIEMNKFRNPRDKSFSKFAGPRRRAS